MAWELLAMGSDRSVRRGGASRRAEGDRDVIIAHGLGAIAKGHFVEAREGRDGDGSSCCKT